MAAKPARTFLSCALHVADLSVRQLALVPVQEYFYLVSCYLLGAENSFVTNLLLSSPPSSFLILLTYNSPPSQTTNRKQHEEKSDMPKMNQPVAAGLCFNRETLVTAQVVNTTPTRWPTPLKP
jgi:hypothetical protein